MNAKQSVDRVNRRGFIKVAGLAGGASALGMLSGSLLVGCGSKPKEIIKLSTQLSWIHSIQFMEFYAAQFKGYFEEEGLEVDFAPGGPGILPGPLVDSKQMDFGLQSSGVGHIAAVAEGAELVSIATNFQRSPAGLMYIIRHPDGKPGTVIDTPEKAIGKRIGLTGGAMLPWHVMAHGSGVTEDDYEVVNISFDPTPLLDGTVDGYWCFATTQPLVLTKMGYEVGVLDAYEWGYKVPGSFITCRREAITQNKEMLVKFTRAVIKGCAYAYKNIDELAKYTVETYGPEYDLVYEDQVSQAEAQIPYVISPFTEANGLLSVSLEDWATSIQILQDMGELTEPMDVNAIATDEITKEVYKAGRIDLKV